MKTSCAWLLLALWLAAGRSAWAHPVAQGTLDLQISTNKIHLQLHVSGEEILIADVFAPADKPKANSLPDLWQRHGQYLLHHLKVFADDRLLAGQVITYEAAKADWVRYQLEYSVASPFTKVRIEEDVLNEIEYAPGNPWEASYVVRIREPGRPTQEGLLLSHRQPLVVACNGIRDASTPTSPAVATLDRGRMAWQYVRHGVGHILSGYDHLLFVLALVLGAATFWDLVKVVTAFTVAHTITLTLSALNIFRLPSHLVEPMIAGSIVVVALTNLFWPRRSRGGVRLGIAFFFGLFHGLGFAGGLLDAMDGLGGPAIGVALAAFSVGVELGHQMVVLPVYGGLKLARSFRSSEANRDQLSLILLRAGSGIICVAGTIYLIAALAASIHFNHE